jgi:hypothetical protein
MVNNSSPQIPGMIYPTQQAMLSGNPRDSAIQQMNNTNMKQANLNASVGGKKRGGAAAIVVPQFQMQYTPQGGPGQTPNAIVQQNLKTGTQGSEYARYDNLATKKGGSRKNRKQSKHNKRNHSTKNHSKRNYKKSKINKKLRGSSRRK